jgi:hypothetical protein
LRNDTEKFAKQFPRRTVSVVRLCLAFDHAEASAAVAGKVDHGTDSHRQHRAFYEILACIAPEHRLGFRVFTKQAAIDSKRQVPTTLGSQFKTEVDQVGWCRHVRCFGPNTLCFEAIFLTRSGILCAGQPWTISRGTDRKKRAGHKPCSKNCVDPISPKNWI